MKTFFPKIIILLLLQLLMFGIEAKAVKSILPQPLPPMQLLRYKVLVLDFYNETKRLELTHLSQAVSSSIEDILHKNSNRFEVISRKEWRKIALREDIKIDSWSQQKVANKIGKALLADIVIMGSFNIQADKITLNTKLINLLQKNKLLKLTSEGLAGLDTMETIEKEALSIAGLLLETFPERKVKVSQIRNIIHRKTQEEVFEKPTQFGALWRSALFPGWGQFYRKRTEKGWYFTTANVLLGATVGISGWLASSRWSEYSSLTKATLGEFNNAYSSYKLWDYVFWTSAITAIGYYTWNLIDAWFFTEFKFDKKNIAFNILPDFQADIQRPQSFYIQGLASWGIRINMQYHHIY